MRALERAWFNGHKGVWLLAPLALLFWLISTFRRYLFVLGVKSSGKPNVPVIVIGNISVGGNGKTPTVMALSEYLTSQGYRPGIVSRGYGATCSTFPHLITSLDTPVFVGDEPYLMHQRLGIPVVIDPKRKRGAFHLVTHCACDVILCDDGLQHYALKRDIEWVVIDGERRHGNGYLLPMGPLREGEWRLSTVDAVIVNGGGDSLKSPLKNRLNEAQNKVLQSVNTLASMKQTKHTEFAMSLQAGELVNLAQPHQRMALSAVKGAVLAIAGIGHPQRFFDTLRQHGVLLASTIAFPDHHPFTPKDIPEFNGMVLMTEKDAVKCRDLAKDNWWYLSVEGKLPDILFEQVLEKLRQITP